MAKTPLSAVVVIDYQNVHLTAYDIFNRGRCQWVLAMSSLNASVGVR